ncbi:hypothetical protein LguiA_025197 [Lonicera macranthoides]
MENSPIPQETKNPYLIPSPNSHSSNNSSISSINGNGLHHTQSPPPTPTTPIPVTRSEPINPYPTTFVQADTSSFKQVVQMLTGSSESSKSRPEPPKNPIPLIKTGPKKASSKLYERRNSLKNFKISPLVSGSGSTRMAAPPDILSPSFLDFPSLAISPVTPLIPDPFTRSDLDMEAEKKAIERKGFYLHPSPSNTPRDLEPRLLPLFPVTSPKVSGGRRRDIWVMGSRKAVKNGWEMGIIGINAGLRSSDPLIHYDLRI